jgi:GNAT superfamily N-acetyltransferase
MPDEAVRTDLDSGNHAFLLFNAGEPVGTLWCRPELNEAAVGVLRKLAVLPAFRGRGYGERLFAHVEGRMKELGATQARLFCNAEFLRLHAYYKRLGYVVTKREQFSTLPFDVLTMEKDLARR